MIMLHDVFVLVRRRHAKPMPHTTVLHHLVTLQSPNLHLRILSDEVPTVQSPDDDGGSISKRIV